MACWSGCGHVRGSGGRGDCSLAEDGQAPGGGRGDPGVGVVRSGRLEGLEGLARGGATPLLLTAGWGRCWGAAGGGWWACGGRLGVCHGGEQTCTSHPVSHTGVRWLRACVQRVAGRQAGRPGGGRQSVVRCAVSRYAGRMQGPSSACGRLEGMVELLTDLNPTRPVRLVGSAAVDHTHIAESPRACPPTHMLATEQAQKLDLLPTIQML